MGQETTTRHEGTKQLTRNTITGEKSTGRHRRMEMMMIQTTFFLFSFWLLRDRHRTLFLLRGRVTCERQIFHEIQTLKLQRHQIRTSTHNPSSWAPTLSLSQPPGPSADTIWLAYTASGGNVASLAISVSLCQPLSMSAQR